MGSEIVQESRGKARKNILQQVTSRVLPIQIRGQETKDVACAFKPNAAFFEAYGSAGWEALQRTLQLIPKEIPLLGV